MRAFSVSMGIRVIAPSWPHLSPLCNGGSEPSLVVWGEGRSGPQILREERRLSPGVVGGACFRPIPLRAPLPQPRGLLLCLASAFPASGGNISCPPVPSPAPELVEWKPEVWGAPPARLLYSSPCIGSFPFLGPGETWFWSHTGTDAFVGGPGQSGCLALGLCPHVSLGRGPGSVHHSSPASYMADSPRESELTHFPFLGPPGLLSPGQQNRQAGL